MANATGRSAHTFHIPVMGTGFMIDAPLNVARYGISSVVSLVDDVLIEQMRKFHCERSGEPYEEIAQSDEDHRARRTTAYLDLLDLLVQRQVDELQASPFEPGSEITRYFEMLPDSAPADAYRDMLETADPDQRREKQDRLREMAVPGGIDVNIMTKVDGEPYRNGKKVSAEFSDASAALRGYALSGLRSSIVLSAGINPRLYGYAAQFDDFYPDGNDPPKKAIILKVSDFHSAAVQGKFLAKRGLWISEYRVESGLNCGGHAFATKGLLLGPIMEEFQDKKEELADQLRRLYTKALSKRGKSTDWQPDDFFVTVQGGIGTAEEHTLLRQHYGAETTGWGTPFLLVPEVTNVDDEHLQKLSEATGDDVYLSDTSPFGLPFWSLKTAASEELRRQRIADGRPGSPCSKGYLKLFDTDFSSQPICTASRIYQKNRLVQLEKEEMPEEKRNALREGVLAKACICHDLAGGVTLKHNIDPQAAPSVCCGPNIAYFAKIAKLEEMVGHIYGRLSLLTVSDRPHMFLQELSLYVDYLRREIDKCRLGLSASTADYFREFTDNLHDGIDHYRSLAGQISLKLREQFTGYLEELRQNLEEVAQGQPQPTA